jgi:hypothetical protein
MPVTANAVAMAAFSLAWETLQSLNRKQIISDDELVQILIGGAEHNIVASDVGPEASAQASALLMDLGKSLSQP